MNILDIGVLSESSGVPASTLRYYEEIGLIKSCGRRGLRRQYAEEVQTQLALIALGKVAGFSLEEIKGMFEPDGKPNLPRVTLYERADELDRQIHRLTTLRNALRHVAECPASSHLHCPSFQKLLRFARSNTATGKQSGKIPGRRTRPG